MKYGTLRLWHKDLIPFLPDHLLLDMIQNAEIIAENLYRYDYPGSEEISKILQFPISHFYTYYMLVKDEYARRGHRIDDSTFMHYIMNYAETDIFTNIEETNIFDTWHNSRYLQQCILILEEMFDNGVISPKDWLKIANGVKNMTELCQETYDSLFTYPKENDNENEPC